MQTHILGFPRIGKSRELKTSLESFWLGHASYEELVAEADALKRRHWSVQREAGLDMVSTGDFSLYDHMLDATLMLGAVPERFAGLEAAPPLERYFAMARGHAGRNIPALEMTKWFDTNYHYLAPEIPARDEWRVPSPQSLPVTEDTRRAAGLGHVPKPVLTGPFTWLALAKEQPGADKWSRLPDILDTYEAVIRTLAPLSGLIQMDEPVLVTELLPARALDAFVPAYERLNRAAGTTGLMLASYFGALGRNLERAAAAGCRVLHVDLVRAPGQLDAVLDRLPEQSALSLGLVNGRNIWRNDLTRSLALVDKAVSRIGADRVLLGSSCSLLHCPVDLEEERELPAHIKKRMAFAVQKCAELALLAGQALRNDPAAMEENQTLFREAAAHPDTVVPGVRERAARIGPDMLRRASPYETRAAAQAWLNLPPLPTTTIGSFPQTPAIRRVRKAFNAGALSREDYAAAIRQEIADCIARQEALGLDVLVHGEAERNDMVEYFGQQLGGFCFTRNGWVQSYGSRCVKPPVIYGDVYRKGPMTLDWIRHAQSLTKKPVKGMLTGPVTILCWSFVREDMERSEVCRQIALAVRDEVRDLEEAGVRIIQIDEAALREGMPLTAAEAETYLAWAVDSFLLAATGVDDATQIHTHMCYSEFNAILPWIARMDADVISIESSRSGMELLDAFAGFRYPAAVGPGVYDIHSPRVPGKDEMTNLLRKALAHIPRERLWVNPDCGLKTRTWTEVWPSLENMVAAARELRRELAD